MKQKTNEPLTIDEVEQLIETAEEASLEDEFVVRTLAHTGMRLIEFVHMTEDWVDSENEYIQIPESEKEWKPSADHHPRKVPIKDEETLEIIQSYFSENDEVDMSGSKARRIVKSIGEGAGIENVTPSTLRQSFANLSLMQGGDLGYIKKVMGLKLENVAEVAGSSDSSFRFTSADIQD